MEAGVNCPAVIYARRSVARGRLRGLRFSTLNPYSFREIPIAGGKSLHDSGNPLYNSRMHPIPVEVVPSHVHVCAADYAVLFGENPATVAHRLSQYGQHVWEETIEISGKLLKRTLVVRVLGPERRATQVELTPTEAKYLGVDASFARSGDLARAGTCVLKGPSGKVTAQAVAIVPKPHVHCSPDEAAALRLENGQEVAVDLMLDTPRTIEGVVVRVHPTYQLRLHLHADIAREHWIAGPCYAELRNIARV